MNTAAFPAKKSIAKYSPMNRKKKFALVCIGIGALMFIGLPTCFHQPPPISVSVDDDRTAKAAAKTFHEDVYAWIMGSEDLAPIIKAKKFAHMVPVDRVDEKDLPFKKYYEEYVLKEKPVVVTNLKSYTNGIWSIEYLKKMCGDNEVTPLVPTTAGSVWANLVPQNDTTFSDFLDNFKTLPQPRPYLHDFSLIRRCPKIMNEFIVPRYYVQDYLVQAYEHGDDGLERPFGKSWPSMFVGGEGTGSGLHIDNSDTHFVMHMLHGVKDFRFLGPHDRILGYEDREEGTFTTDIFNPDFEKHPLLALATVYETTIYPGDFLFMPGGSAHQTINREGGAVAISSNYIDASNLVRCTTAFDEKHRYDLSDDLRRRAAQKLSVTRMDVVDTPWPKLFPEYAVAP